MFLFFRNILCREAVWVDFLLSSPRLLSPSAPQPLSPSAITKDAPPKTRPHPRHRPYCRT